MLESQISSLSGPTGLDAHLLDLFAKQTGFVVRKTTGFSAGGFLLSCLKAVSTGKASFRALARCMVHGEAKSLSRQALHYRSNLSGVEFLRKVASHLTGKLSASTSAAGEGFSRILIQDSSQLRMHRGNVEHFRAVSNQGGPTAGAKLDCIGEIVSGALLDTKITEGHTQDKTSGPRLLDHLSPGDLVLRDMGYFDIKSFKVIEERGAHWISRLHGMAAVTLPSGKLLEKSLKSTRLNTIDEPCVMVTEKRHNCRLIAIRTPEPLAARRRALKRHKRKLNKTNPSKNSLVREGWTIYLTNLPADQWSAEQIHALYGQRWNIEIRFRALKSSTEMKSALNRKTNRHHLEILLLAAVIQSLLCALQHQKIRLLKHPRAVETSIELVSAWLQSVILTMCRINDPIRCDPRHLLPEKRKRKTLRQKLNALF